MATKIRNIVTQVDTKYVMFVLSNTGRTLTAELYFLTSYLVAVWLVLSLNDGFLLNLYQMVGAWLSNVSGRAPRGPVGGFLLFCLQIAIVAFASFHNISFD